MLAGKVTTSPVSKARIPKPSLKCRLKSQVGMSAPTAGVFLIAVPVRESTPVPFTAVLNWQPGLKK